MRKTNEAPQALASSEDDDAREAERAEALLYAEPTLSMSEIVFTDAELRAQQVGNTKAIAKRNEANAKSQATTSIDADGPAASVASITPSEPSRKVKGQRRGAAPREGTLSLKSQIME